jgi:HD-GYP domain-containing protein (c-di-GMP phosphodiesterase class II)
MRAVRLAEVLAAFATAADAGMGMPMDHNLRAAAVAVRLGALSGASAAEQSDAFYLALLRYVGCTADSDLAADVMGDEVALRGALYGVDWGAPSDVLPRMARAIAGGKGVRGAARFVKTLSGMPKLFATAQSHCEVGDRLAAALGFGPAFRAALLQTFERWDGKGWPKRTRGEAIARAMRFAHAAEELEIGHREGGDEAAIARARRLAGHSIDPELAELAARNSTEACMALREPSPWRAALAAEPEPRRGLDDAPLDESLRALADFADLKSRFTRGHSRSVAALARAAAASLRLGADAEALLERAALVHDLGRVAISAAVWDKPGPLSDAERERVRLHTYVGERVLAPSAELAPIASVAMLAHERLDGSGYHRGLDAHACRAPARLLAAADVYGALIEERPHRRAFSLDRAAAELSKLGNAGQLCPDAVAAVLVAAGQSAAPRAPDRRELSDRELEVLRLVARGLTNKEVAGALDLSPKTVSRHLEHIYEKIGVTTRAGATMVAMQRGLLR